VAGRHLQRLGGVALHQCCLLVILPLLADLHLTATHMCRDLAGGWSLPWTRG
jgi:hypothetical protein